MLKVPAVMSIHSKTGDLLTLGASLIVGPPIGLGLAMVATALANTFQ